MNADSSRGMRVLRSVLWIAYAVIWLGGVGGHLLFGKTPANMSWTSPLFLLLSGALVLVAAPEDWFGLMLAAFIGFLAEVIGVFSGFPFGKYTYSGVLAPSILGVPLVMAAAWMVLIAWVRQLNLPVWAGALVTTAFDLAIDPVAVNSLGFWQWRSSGAYYGIPAVNFVGWFAVSLLVLLLVPRKPLRNGHVFLVGLSILLFFALTSLAHGFFVPSSSGWLLAALGYWRWRSSKVSTRI